MSMDWHAMEQDLIHQIRTGDGAVTSGVFAGRQVLLLTTTGAVSGEPRQTPLVYSEDGGRWSSSRRRVARRSTPAWYKNLLKHPEVTIETGGRTLRGTGDRGGQRGRATTHLRPARRAARQLHDIRGPRRTDRVIPVILLERIAVPV